MLNLVASPTKSGEGSLLVNIRKILPIKLEMTNVKTDFRLGLFSQEFD